MTSRLPRTLSPRPRLLFPPVCRPTDQPPLLPPDSQPQPELRVLLREKLLRPAAWTRPRRPSMTRLPWIVPWQMHLQKPKKISTLRQRSPRRGSLVVKKVGDVGDLSHLHPGPGTRADPTRTTAKTTSKPTTRTVCSLDFWTSLQKEGWVPQASSRGRWSPTLNRTAERGARTIPPPRKSRDRSSYLQGRRWVSSKSPSEFGKK